MQGQLLYITFPLLKSLHLTNNIKLIYSSLQILFLCLQHQNQLFNFYLVLCIHNFTPKLPNFVLISVITQWIMMTLHSCLTSSCILNLSSYAYIIIYNYFLFHLATFHPLHTLHITHITFLAILSCLLHNHKCNILSFFASFYLITVSKDLI